MSGSRPTLFLIVSFFVEYFKYFSSIHSFVPLQFPLEAAPALAMRSLPNAESRRYPTYLAVRNAVAWYPRGLRIYPVPNVQAVRGCVVRLRYTINSTPHTMRRESNP